MTLEDKPGRAAIVRRAGTRTLHAWHWHALPQLRAVIGWRDARACVFADLSLGAWRGHWLARALCAQLGLPEPGNVHSPLSPDLPPDSPPDSPPDLPPDAPHAAQLADALGRMVDTDTRGDANTIAALAHARAIVARMRARRVRHVLVVAPLPGHAWGSENLGLLRLLCDAAPAHGFRLGLLLRGDGAAPEAPGFEVRVHTHPRAVDAAARPWCAIPGLLDPALVPEEERERVGIETITLAGGLVLLSPNCRPVHGIPALAPPGLPDCLRVPFALRTPQQDVAFLRREAGLRYAEGAYALAHMILDGIRVAPLSQLQEAEVPAQRLYTAIALADPGRAARGARPDAGLDDDLQASLCHGQAWGLAMSGHPDEAQALLARAGHLRDAHAPPRLQLHALALSALDALHRVEVEDALAMECEIARRLDAVPHPDWHLVASNSQRLADLHTRLGHLDEAARWHARGVCVTHQLRNESDLLYGNLCFARLADLPGAGASSLLHWLRAALHWQSNPLPEALAPRAVQAVLGRPPADREADVEAISQVLEAGLDAAARRQDIDAGRAARAIPMHRVGPASLPDACIGEAGWSIMTSTHDHGPPPFDGPRYAALNRLLVGLLTHLAPRAALEGARCGIELPADPREMLWSCLAWNVPVLLAGGRRCRPEKQDPASLAAAFTVRQSAAIDHLDTVAPAWRVHYKRYLPPRTLAPAEQACLAHLAEPIGLARLAAQLDLAPRACIGFIQRLAQARLVEVA